jgi:hypothetical protein
MFHILPPDHPIVIVATDALVEFAGDGLERDLAAVLLPAWQGAKGLTDREFRSILATFPLPADTPPDSWLHLTGDALGQYPEGQYPEGHGWISGSMGTDDGQ